MLPHQMLDLEGDILDSEPSHLLTSSYIRGLALSLPSSLPSQHAACVHVYLSASVDYQTKMVDAPSN